MWCISNNLGYLIKVSYAGLIYLILYGFFFAPEARAQLLELEVEEVERQSVAVFQDYPNDAAVVIESSISGLQIESNLEIIADLSEPGEGIYRVVIPAARQIIYISAPGYQRSSYRTESLNPRDVKYLSVEPKETNISETGDILVRSEPEGATITLEGLPGEYETPYTFTNILAQTYTMRLELDGYRTEERQIRVDPLRPTVEDVTLISNTAFLIVETEDAQLYLSSDQDNIDGEYRVGYTPGEPLSIEEGTYDYRLSREDYVDDTGSFTLSAGATANINPELEPTYGFVNISTPDAELFLKSGEMAQEYRVSYSPGEPLKLDIGTYDYRLSREYYNDETGSFNVTAENTVSVNPRFEPNFATLRVNSNARNISLRAPDNQAPPSRQSGTIYLERGLREVIVQASGYESQALDIRARAGAVIDTTITLVTVEEAARQNYATLRVNANARNISLRAPDNQAPPSRQTNTIFLERGLREVIVEASGYESRALNISAEAGAMIDTTITLVTVEEAARQRRREELPPGILSLASDVDAEIFINGEQKGRQSVSLTLPTDTYTVEMRHPLGSKRFFVTVPSADVAERYEVFRPSKGRALTYSALLPGGGHFYTNRSRGYLYLGAAVAAAGFTAWSVYNYNQAGSDVDAAVRSYNEAGSVTEANQRRGEVMNQYDDQLQAYDTILIGAAALAGVYAIQLLDITFTSPRYGYRNGETSMAGLQAGFGGDGIALRFSF